jgi:Uma2 family endonuclease
MLHSVSAPALLTADELERISIPGKVTELIRGRLVVHEPPGTWHGAISARLTCLLGDFVHRRGLGMLFSQDTGFKIGTDPDTVRAPDVAFVARERVGVIRERGYAALAPDLLAEVLSPDDRPAEVLAKVADWLAAGTRIVWLIDPQRRDARVYRPDGSLSVLGSDDSLEGEDVLPGFTCPLKDVLA